MSFNKRQIFPLRKLVVQKVVGSRWSCPVMA
jgi:hypothetical protein